MKEQKTIIKLGNRFPLGDGNYGKITEIFADGLHYHTLDAKGNCIKGQQYILKSDFKF